MTELASVDVICSAQQLAELLSITTRRVDRLAEDKILKPVRSSKFKGRRYRLAASVQAYLAYQKQYVKEQNSSSKNGDAYNDARSRRMRALALIEEARAKQISGEFVRRDRVTYVMT